MTGHEPHVVGERQELRADRTDQGVEVATREVGAPDRPLEQHVAHDREATRGVDEHDVSGRVTGTMTHLEARVPHVHDVTADEPARRRERARRFESVASGRFGQPLDPESVVDVRPHDRHGQAFGQRRGLTRVIDVRVRQEDRFDRGVASARGRENAFEIAARIHDRRLAGLRAAQDRAVLGERRDGDDERLDHERSPIQW